MKTTLFETVSFGDLVVAAFDEAATHSTDPLEVARLATAVVIGTARKARTTLCGDHRLVFHRVSA